MGGGIMTFETVSGRRSYHRQGTDAYDEGSESLGLDVEVRSVCVLGYLLGVLVTLCRIALGYDFGDRAAVQAEGIGNAIPGPLEDSAGLGWGR